MAGRAFEQAARAVTPFLSVSVVSNSSTKCRLLAFSRVSPRAHPTAVAAQRTNGGPSVELDGLTVGRYLDRNVALTQRFRERLLLVRFAVHEERAT